MLRASVSAVRGEEPWGAPSIAECVASEAMAIAWLFLGRRISVGRSVGRSVGQCVRVCGLARWWVGGLVCRLKKLGPVDLAMLTRVTQIRLLNWRTKATLLVDLFIVVAKAVIILAKAPNGQYFSWQVDSEG